MVAAALADGVKAELYLTPKPGLVDLHDCGSHDDLSLVVVERLADAGEAGPARSVTD